MNPYVLYLMIVGMRRLSYSTVYTLFAVYLIRVVGTNPLELVIPGAIYESAIFLFEIPTGVVADVYSRRLSVIIGFFLMGAGFIVAGTLPALIVIVVGMAILGVGSTFVSGALSAWLVDEVGQERASQAFLRAAQVSVIASFIGILLSILLGSVNLQFSIMVGGILLILMAIAMTIVMPETGFTRRPASERESWHDFFATLHKGAQSIRTSRIVLWVLVVTFMFAGFGETFGKLWQAHILDNFSLPTLGNFEDIVWFGIISGLSIPVTLIATEFARKRLDLSDNIGLVRALMLLFLALTVSALVFALSDIFILMLVGIWMTRMMMTMIAPLMETWLNQHVPSDIRATVLSMVGQVQSLGEIAVGGPVAGGLATIFSIRITIAVVALSLLPLTSIFLRTLRTVANQPD